MSVPAAIAPARRAALVIMVEGVPFAGFCAALALAAHGGLWALDIALFVTLYLLTMAGVEVGMHRHLAHRQFDAAAPLRAVLLVAGSMAGEGSPLLWSAVHRLHHSRSDVDGDPHSPVLGRHGLRQRIRGFLWAQFLWYADLPAITRFARFLARRRRDRDAPPASPGGEEQVIELARLIADGVRDPLVARVDRLYPAWVALGYALPAALAAAITHSWVGALHGLLWGGFARDFAVKQVSFAINSLGHTVGLRSLRSQDDSRNNVLMSLLTWGSGWHNNHHAFPASATLDFRWWQIDPGAWLIRAWRKLGLAWNVRMADPAAIAARRRPPPGAASTPAPG
jgi:stearoyl-CoA desaturase (delta-9 desaturase)